MIHWEKETRWRWAKLVIRCFKSYEYPLSSDWDVPSHNEILMEISLPAHFSHAPTCRYRNGSEKKILQSGHTLRRALQLGWSPWAPSGVRAEKARVRATGQRMPNLITRLRMVIRRYHRGRLAQGHAFELLCQRPRFGSREGIWTGVSVPTYGLVLFNNLKKCAV